MTSFVAKKTIQLLQRDKIRRGKASSRKAKGHQVRLGAVLLLGECLSHSNAF